MFEPVPKELDVPALEGRIMRFWEEHDVERRYLERNQHAEERFSFIDGPITANGPMGVHHAWGRTYKDLWQRYNTMLGKRQRYQNGFDGQGLWVEVTVERALGFTSKRAIEAFGIAEFVRKCKESVFHFADMQTRQSKRLGQFMDWRNSYYTLSDENNYTIWRVLKQCHERGLLYRGHDVMPWCTRCGAGISEQEMAEGYEDRTHRSVYVRFPLIDRPGESLLIWTTTPWTLTSNVAVAINPALTYMRVRQAEEILYLARGAVEALHGAYQTLDELPGDDLLGWRYRGPFDNVPAAQGVARTVIPWDEVSEAEGTGLVHIAPGCGKEDFALKKQLHLDMIVPIDEAGTYIDGFDWLTGQSVHEVADRIVEDLDRRGLLYRAHDYTHRYPTCWRCHTELVFRLVDEWFIAMEPLRDAMMRVARQVRWLPPYGLDRELDWLRNMDDWMISKKRYWGLALPFWRCPDGHLQVIGGKDELAARAIGGIEHLESPHRPWVDEVRISCPACGQVAERIPDVGNVWLDAGIVPFSTLQYDTNPDHWRAWFPADFITESFPGQFRNWFYSMLAMSTILEDTTAFKTVLGYALVRDEHGREMHKSWGNLIPFDQAAEREGADVMRWLFCQHSPETNLNFGWDVLTDVKRRLLVLWNTYSFFVTYANADGWRPEAHSIPVRQRPLLDRWVLARLNGTIAEVRTGLDAYDARGASQAIERFIEQLSTWYVRRSRRRFWKAEADADKRSAYETLYECLRTVTILLAPFVPFVSEALYQNLVRSVDGESPISVHLNDYPDVDPQLVDQMLLETMESAQRVVALGRAARDRLGIKVRQPLATMYVKAPSRSVESQIREVQDIILEELNVKSLRFAQNEDAFVDFDVRPNLPILGPRYGKRLGPIRRALVQLDPAQVAHGVERGEVVELEVGGEVVQLAPSDLLIDARQREGFGAISQDGYLVALDSRLSDALVHEGLAREVIRRINDWRRSAGFRVEDRISVWYGASSRLARAMADHREYIMAETLATTLTTDAGPGTGFAAEASVDGEWLRAELSEDRCGDASL